MLAAGSACASASTFHPADRYDCYALERRQGTTISTPSSFNYCKQA
jgi:hypothetical protein